MKKILLLLLALNTFLSAQNVPYTLVISFDAFRWDYLDRGVSPNLNKVRENGFSAKALQPCFPSKTFPNHLSIITGMYPENHGIISNSFSDPKTGEWYRIGNLSTKCQSKWYKGEMFWETAKKNGIKTASYFWPGSDLENENRNPDYYHIYEHERPYLERVEGVVNWFNLPYNERPRFVNLYFDHTDTYGHNYGPNSEEILTSIALLDSIYRVLDTKLNEIGMLDSINIIILSDHGMTEISDKKMVNIDTILTGLEYHLEGSEPFILIEPSKKDSVEIFKRLSANQDHYKFYTKQTIPERYHFSKHYAIRSFILVSNLGWSLTNFRWIEKNKKYVSKGNHGYDNKEMDMHGIFIGKGPAFKSGFKTGIVRNIDIYPLLCKIYGIAVPDSIDGSLEGIEQILK